MLTFKITKQNNPKEINTKKWHVCRWKIFAFYVYRHTCPLIPTKYLKYQQKYGMKQVFKCENAKKNNPSSLTYIDFLDVGVVGVFW